MLKCDIFVFSDDVQYPKKGPVNRVQIPVANEAAYLTLPVQRGDDDCIATKKYVKDTTILNRLLKTIQFNLGGLPYYQDLNPILEHFSHLYWRCDKLAEFNIGMISFIASLLGICTTTLRGTQLGLREFRGNERLIKRCEILHSNVYLCGQGADGYQDEEQLNSAGIQLRRVDYDVGQNVLGEDLKYSVIFGIGRYGMARLKDGIMAEYKAGPSA